MRFSIDLSKSEKGVQLAATLGLLALFVELLIAVPAFAQFSDGIESLRTPLIPGAPNSNPYQCPMEGQAPPLGDGFAPPPVTCGQAGMEVLPPPTQVPSVPPVPGGPEGKAMVNSYAAPYLTPPPSHPAPDQGMIDSPQDFAPPPVTVTNINPGGGISGNAPTQRWGGQTTRDFGRGGSGSCVRDFGQKLTKKPDLKTTPQTCEDGPRQSAAGGGRASNLPGSQPTQDRYGNRTMFSTQRARLTIAPY